MTLHARKPQAWKESVKSEDGGIRLDHWLSARARVSRSQAQKLIRGGCVSMGSTVAHKAGTIVREGDVIAWTTPVVTVVDGAPVLPVLYEDEVCLVIDKPAGITVHHAPGVHGLTVVDSIRAYLGATDWDERAGLVHRLDKDTSGALLVAKGPGTLAALQRQWQDRTIQKKYQALVGGILKPERGTIESPIARHAIDRKKMRVSREGKESVTHYTVIRYCGDNTYAELEPVTGRTHQIRVHFAAIGYPVVGDTLYGNSSRNAAAVLSGLTRQFLHASVLAFDHPVRGDRITVTSPLPGDLAAVLKVLESAQL